jgi:hypothetical protein
MGGENMTTGTRVPLGTLGEIVSWRAPGEVRYVDLQNAMKTAGIDETLLREMLPRHGFSRAARKLSEGRIIRKVSEDDTSLKFQFTKEYLRGGQFEYALETHLELNKATGLIDCPDYSLQTMAQQLLAGEMAVRKSSDVTRLIQRTFDQNKGDLIPIREQGGVYFVPESHEHLADSVDNLLRAIGGALRRFKVSADGASTSQSVASAMNDHFESLIAEFEASCASVGSDASPTVQKNRTERINELRVKLNAYKDIMQDYAETIEKKIEAANAELLARLGDEPAKASQPDTQQQQPAAKPAAPPASTFSGFGGNVDDLLAGLLA